MEKYIRIINFTKHKYQVNVGLYEDRAGIFAAQALGALRALFEIVKIDTDLTTDERGALYEKIGQVSREIEA